jgi:hypothetical protein
MQKEYDFYKGKRGLVALSQSCKVRITTRIDADTQNWLRER